MKDQLVRAMTKDGFVNAGAVTTTGIVERARQIHKTLPTATAALGRLLTAASMMGNMQKGDDGSITLQLKGGGPRGRLLAVSDAEGNVRGWVANGARNRAHARHTDALLLGSCLLSPKKKSCIWAIWPESHSRTRKSPVCRAI